MQTEIEMLEPKLLPPSGFLMSFSSQSLFCYGVYAFSKPLSFLFFFLFFLFFFPSSFSSSSSPLSSSSTLFLFLSFSFLFIPPPPAPPPFPLPPSSISYTHTHTHRNTPFSLYSFYTILNIVVQIPILYDVIKYFLCFPVQFIKTDKMVSCF